MRLAKPKKTGDFDTSKIIKRGLESLRKNSVNRTKSDTVIKTNNNGNNNLKSAPKTGHDARGKSLYSRTASKLWSRGQYLAANNCSHYVMVIATRQGSNNNKNKTLLKYNA